MPTCKTGDDFVSTIRNCIMSLYAENLCLKVVIKSYITSFPYFIYNPHISLPSHLSTQANEHSGMFANVSVSANREKSKPPEAEMSERRSRHEQEKRPAGPVFMECYCSSKRAALDVSWIFKFSIHI